MMLKTISFSQNWNNKLNCNYFTTLRLFDAQKYVEGEQYNIVDRGRLLGVATLVGRRVFFAKDFNKFICFLDTGCTPDATKTIFEKMYKGIDFDTQRFDFLLLRFDSRIQ